MVACFIDWDHRNAVLALLIRELHAIFGLHLAELKSTTRYVEAWLTMNFVRIKWRKLMPAVEFFSFWQLKARSDRSLRTTSNSANCDQFEIAYSFCSSRCKRKKSSRAKWERRSCFIITWATMTLVSDPLLNCITSPMELYSQNLDFFLPSWI